MKELTPYDNEYTATDLDSILDRCIIKNGKLVPAPMVIQGHLENATDDTDTYNLFDDQEHAVEPEVILPAYENPRRNRTKIIMARAALIGAITIIPIQSADAFISNRSFFEVNIIEDGIHAIENAAVIGNNTATAFNSIKSTVENVVKLANGGK